MGQGVFTRKNRFTWIEKTIGEVGDGTGFPMEVTGTTVAEKLDKIAEIFYRVKDAWFTAGSETITVSGNSGDITASTTAPSQRATETSFDTYQYRGYTKPETSTYYGDLYSTGVGSHSDIADNEYGIWVGPHWSGSPQSSFIDAFHYAADDPSSNHVTDSNWFSAYGVVGVGAAVYRGSRVAVVRLNPTDGFYAATNRFFLELEFYYFDYNPILSFGASTSINGSIAGDPDDPGEVTNICNYVIRLSSGDLTCPIYAGNLGADSVSGSDFIHEAKVWWPYAKGSPAAPVWDASSGALL